MLQQPSPLRLDNPITSRYILCLIKHLPLQLSSVVTNAIIGDYR